MNNNPAEQSMLVLPQKNFQGNAELENLGKDDLIRELSFFCRHPKILKMLNHTRNIIIEGFKKEIADLENLEGVCSIIPLNRNLNNVIMIDTQEDEEYKEYLNILEKYPKYREKRIKDHQLIMKAYKIEGA